MLHMFAEYNPFSLGKQTQLERGHTCKEASYNDTPAYHVPLTSKNSAPPVALELLSIIW
jgi:hypothetical protein